MRLSFAKSHETLIRRSAMADYRNLIHQEHFGDTNTTETLIGKYARKGAHAIELISAMLPFEVELQPQAQIQGQLEKEIAAKYEAHANK